ncbi:hypothetical protein [Peribacillus muralis]|uniref:hypothetical protein n=1 Tax=Peribacillus muralis TaxID=264697 RepID=UPI00366C3821
MEKKPEKKMKHVIKWTVNPYRKDKRTGAIHPIQTSRYQQYAYDELDCQFPKE